MTARLNMVDGVGTGFKFEESLEIAEMLESDDDLDALPLTSGSSLTNPMFLFRGGVPLRKFVDTMPPL